MFTLAKSYLSLQALLEGLAEPPGRLYAYFQPPEDQIMEYPCVRYSRTGDRSLNANNNEYGYSWEYQLILMTWDVDDPYLTMIRRLQYCSFERHYETAGLHHYVFNIFH